MHQNNRKDKGLRYVLVLMSDKIIKDCENIYHVIPISNANDPDEINFPLADQFIPCDDHSLTKKCVAVMIFYQPVEYCFFEQKWGTIKNDLYNAMKLWLRTMLIGEEDFDLEC